jgi:hypothetical protein
MLSLERLETLDAGLTRIARQTVEHVVVHLTDSTADTNERVHETRKRLKEIRAVLRLGRFGLDGDFGALNGAFRDAARQLASAREADALVAMAKSLHGTTRDPLERRALTRVARLLAEDQPAASLPAIDFPVVTFAAHGTRWFERGLRRTYRGGRRAFRRARRERTAAAIHEWRKRVKDLWYETQIVAPAWPEVLDARVEMLHDLSRLLGDHHDVWALESHVAEHRRRFGKITAQRMAVVAALRLAEIEAAIFEKGAFAYAESPRAWSESIVAYWRAWSSPSECGA